MKKNSNIASLSNSGTKINGSKVAKANPAAIQRKLQDIADNSPQIKQLKSYQQMADSEFTGQSHKPANALPIVQRKIKPSRKLSVYLEPYSDKKPRIKEIISGLFTSLLESGFTFDEEEIHDAIRVTPDKDLSGLFQKLQESRSADKDEELGGTRAHGLSRHYAISDADLEARLRGPGAIAAASRFKSSEGARVTKIHNLIKSSLIKFLSPTAKQIGEKIHSVMHDEP